jgi:hypothetical protein
VSDDGAACAGRLSIAQLGCPSTFN